VKTCSKCRITKPLSEFYIHRRYGKEGIRAACKECTRKDNKKWRDALTLEKKATWEKQKREWQSANPERIAQHHKNCHNPKKVKARSLARKLNRIQERPTRCERCGRKRLLEKHHEDYDQPLQVMWLCKKCHEEIDHKGELYGYQGTHASAC